jgi:hypothetical protein
VLSLAMMWIAVGEGGAGEWHPWRALDWLSLAAAVAAIAMSVPVIFALAGFYTADLPLLRSIYMSRGVQDGVETVYVHVGEHHGFAGLFMMIAGLALARAVVVMRPSWLRLVAGWYVSLLVIYGATNMVQDFWGEQLVKRGTTDHTIPNMLRPALTIDWLYVAAGVVVFWFVYFRLFGESGQRAGELFPRATAGRRSRRHAHGFETP